MTKDTSRRAGRKPLRASLPGITDDWTNFDNAQTI